MGGAMGALGADISTISSNPAGIGLISKNDMSLTGGVVWQGTNSAKGMAKSTFAQFDQIGAVVSFKMSNKVRNLNLGFNYQEESQLQQQFLWTGVHCRLMGRPAGCLGRRSV